MVNRRSFLKRSATGSLMLMTGSFPIHAFGDPYITSLTILHTNDVHSRIEPFPMDGSRNQGLGGVEKRKILIDKIRAEKSNVLLFDAGDIFQGTPYFNFFGGELEMKLMSMLKYDAATIGNHDFDAGIDGLLKQMKHADFPLLSANYDFSNTLLNKKIESYKVYEKGEIRIGVFGLGIELEGLVPKPLYKDTLYLDPIKAANKSAAILKSDYNCDFVVCLSHLGYKYRNDKISDMVLAKSTENIDLIIGGHSHTFMREPVFSKNVKGKPVIINQVGWAGIMMGQIEVQFEYSRKNSCVTCNNQYVN